MQIEYLKFYEQALKEESNNSRGLSIPQIEILERHFYPLEPRQFPRVLREYLFLAGGNSSKLSTHLEDYHTLELDELLSYQRWMFNVNETREFIEEYFPNKNIWIWELSSESEDYFIFVDLEDKYDNPRYYIFDSYSFEQGKADYIQTRWGGVEEEVENDNCDESIPSTLLEAIARLVPEELRPPRHELTKRIPIKNGFTHLSPEVKKDLRSFYRIGYSLEPDEFKDRVGKLKFLNLDLALWHAFRNRQFQFADILIEMGGNLNVYSSLVLTILFKTNDVVLLKRYLDKGLTIKEENCFDFVVHANSAKSALFLLDSGYCLNKRNKTLFWQLVSLGDLELVKRLVISHGSMVDIPSKNQNERYIEFHYENHIIKYLVQSNSIEIIEFILQFNPVFKKYKYLFMYKAMALVNEKILLWAYTQPDINYRNYQNLPYYSLGTISETTLEALLPTHFYTHIGFNKTVAILSTLDKPVEMKRKVLDSFSYRKNHVETLIKELRVFAHGQIKLLEIQQSNLIPKFNQILSTLEPHWFHHFLLNKIIKFENLNELFQFITNKELVEYCLAHKIISWSKKELELVEILQSFKNTVVDLNSNYNNEKIHVFSKQRVDIEILMNTLEDWYKYSTLKLQDSIFINEIKAFTLLDLKSFLWDKKLLGCAVFFKNYTEGIIRFWLLTDEAKALFLKQLIKHQQKETLRIYLRKLKAKGYDVLKIIDLKDHREETLLDLIQNVSDRKTLDSIFQLYPNYSYWETYALSNKSLLSGNSLVYEFLINSECLSPKLAKKLLNYIFTIELDDSSIKDLKRLINTIEPSYIESFLQNLEFGFPGNYIQEWFLKGHLKIASYFVHLFRTYSPESRFYTIVIQISLSDYKSLTEEQKWFIEKHKVGLMITEFNVNHNLVNKVLRIESIFIKRAKAKFIYSDFVINRPLSFIYKSTQEEEDDLFILSQVNETLTIQDVEHLCRSYDGVALNRIINLIIEKSMALNHKNLYLELIGHYWDRQKQLEYLYKIKDKRQFKLVSHYLPWLITNSRQEFLNALEYDNILLFDAYIHAGINLEDYSEFLVNYILEKNDVSWLKLFLDFMKMKEKSYLMVFGENIPYFKYILSHYMLSKTEVIKTFLTACYLNKLEHISLLKRPMVSFPKETEIGLLLALSKGNYKVADYLITYFKASPDAFYGALSLYKNDVSGSDYANLKTHLNGVQKKFPSLVLKIRISSILKREHVKWQLPSY